jgi:hypothetical protein
LFWRQKPKTKIRYSVRNRRGDTHNPSIAVLSSCQTETAIISGIWNGKSPGYLPFPFAGTCLWLVVIYPNREALANETFGDDYIVLSKKPDYKNNPSWLNETSRHEFIKTHKLRFLRPYQVRAITAIQKAVQEGRDRFLFEMATGTAKTLVSAAVIKLFKRTDNTRRTLFLVDRLELEQQAQKILKIT